MRSDNGNCPYLLKGASKDSALLFFAIDRDRSGDNPAFFVILRPPEHGEVRIDKSRLKW
jgi:hypothetical protein